MNSKKGTDWQAIGTQSQAVGEAFETELMFQVSRCIDLRIVKQHPETKFFGAGRAKVVGDAYPDFILFASDFTAVFDTKSIGNDSYFQVPRKRERQFEFLVDASLIVPAGYLIEWRKYGLIGWHPVRPDMRMPHRVKMGEGGSVVSHDLGGRWFSLLLEVIGYKE